MGYKSINNTTINRSTYNKTRKLLLADCSRCPWNRYDNIKRGHKFYSNTVRPNWKLFTKQSKQWVKYKLTSKVKYLMSN